MGQWILQRLVNTGGLNLSLENIWRGEDSGGEQTGLLYTKDLNQIGGPTFKFVGDGSGLTNLPGGGGGGTTYTAGNGISIVR